MTIKKNRYPILEYDTEYDGIIKPNRANKATLPDYCLMTFFGEILDQYVARNNYVPVNAYGSEMRSFPIYLAQTHDLEFCLVQAAVGSASIAMMTDYLIGYGVKNIITCGACGVLDDIPAGDVIIPTSALRDEGASYHYLPPTRDIQINQEMVAVIRQTLQDAAVPFSTCKTWTTDAVYRETPAMVEYRRKEGCAVVEMECAAIAAVSQFRQIRFGQLLYSGDILAKYDRYDERAWNQNLTAREKLFLLSIDALSRLYSNDHPQE